MQPPPEKPIHLILGKQGSSLHKLLAQNKHIQDINNLVKKMLGEPLSEHVSAISYDKGKLVLGVSNASWHHHIRYQTTELLEGLRKNGLHGLINIQLKIEPKILALNTLKQFADKPDNLETEKSAPLSAEESDSIKILADSINDEELKKALQKLAENC